MAGGRPPKNYTKEQVLEAINGSATIMSTIAKRLGCNWRVAKKYVYKWQETRSAYNDELEKNIDFAEGKLLENIKKNDLGAIKYFLSKKAKTRGYGDEEILNKDIDNKLEIIIDSLGGENEAQN